MTAAPIAVYTNADSPRLRYVLRWLLEEQLGLGFELRSYYQFTPGNGISYGRDLPGCIYIPDTGLLWEKDVHAIPATTGTWEDIPTIFAGTRGGRHSVPFDIFSAIFFLLSRYEEYFPFDPDRHGRYPATESILYQEGWLERPLVDEWTEQFRSLLMQRWMMALPRKSTFHFQPTYDIDIAWSYRHKGWKRWMGGLLTEGLRLKWKMAFRRIHVVAGAADPYDAFDWISELHTRHRLDPYYFILAAQATTDFDKNIPPSHPAMQALIRRLGGEGSIGMHPSYHSDKSVRSIRAEKKILETILQKEVTQSRQHFIRMHFPDTYHMLLQAGITDDYSMGYSTRPGFRAGTARRFLWYDLSGEQETVMRIYPFCFMDTTAHYDLHLSAEAAFTRLMGIAELLRQVNSPLYTVFHNFSLGTDPGWKGWREAYAGFVAEISQWRE